MNHPESDEIIGVDTDDLLYALTFDEQKKVLNAISFLANCEDIGTPEEYADYKEKQEREQGCEYCLKNKPIKGIHDVSIAYVQGKELLTTYSDPFYNLHLDIHYCPMCGRKLKEED